MCAAVGAIYACPQACLSAFIVEDTTPRVHAPVQALGGMVRVSAAWGLMKNIPRA